MEEVEGDGGVRWCEHQTFCEMRLYLDKIKCFVQKLIHIWPSELQINNFSQNFCGKIAITIKRHYFPNDKSLDWDQIMQDRLERNAWITVRVSKLNLEEHSAAENRYATKCMTILGCYCCCNSTIKSPKDSAPQWCGIMVKQCIHTTFPKDHLSQ